MDKEESTSARSASTEEHGKEFVDSHGHGGEEPKEEKSWFQKLNPFYSGEVPPVPLEDAGLVPEMQANFLSKLTWGWMGPLMMVTYLCKERC